MYIPRVVGNHKQQEVAERQVERGKEYRRMKQKKGRKRTKRRTQATMKRKQMMTSLTLALKKT